MTRKEMVIGMEKRIDTNQMNAIISFEMYFGGRALKDDNRNKLSRLGGVYFHRSIDSENP